jgi:hypothetical protein
VARNGDQLQGQHACHELGEKLRTVLLYCNGID